MALQFVPNPNPIVLHTLQGVRIVPKLRAPVTPVADSKRYSDHSLKMSQEHHSHSIHNRFHSEFIHYSFTIPSTSGSPQLCNLDIESSIEIVTGAVLKSCHLSGFLSVRGSAKPQIENCSFKAGLGGIQGIQGIQNNSFSVPECSCLYSDYSVMCCKISTDTERYDMILIL